jgi:hypothetical protein
MTLIAVHVLAAFKHLAAGGGVFERMWSWPPRRYAGDELRSVAR